MEIDEGVDRGSEPERNDHVKMVEPKTQVTITAVKKMGRVLVTGDFILRGIEAPICHPHNLSRELCCLLGACIRDTRRRLLGMTKPEDYHLFLLEAATRKLNNIKKLFMSLWKMLKGSAAQVVFSKTMFYPYYTEAFGIT